MKTTTREDIYGERYKQEQLAAAREAERLAWREHGRRVHERRNDASKRYASDATEAK